MNTNALRGKMAERRKTQRLIAKELGITPQTLSRKLAGKRQFTVEEASKLCEVLGLSGRERTNIFLP